MRVLDVQLDSADAIVFNLEVSGTFTYYANGVWVHNNSCRQLLFHRHHLLPEFLGGASGGLLTFLPEGLHREYHAGLLRALTAAGVRRKGNEKWDSLFARDPDEQIRALDVLMTYTRTFDLRHRTELTSGIWAQIADQWWK